VFFYVGVNMSFPRYERYKDSGVEWLGAVPEGWRLPKLKHFIRFYGGGTPSRDNLDYWNGDIPWVSPKDMKTEFIESAEESITETGLENSSSTIVQPGCVLIVVRSGILKHTIPVAINNVTVTLNQDMKALVFDETSCLNSFFLRWVQGLNDLLLLAWAKQGATVESIEHAYLAETVMPLPPLPEQHTIAAFLDRETGKIDELVAEQERLIALLKEKRQTVISHAVTKGLNPDAPMKDSGIEWLGEVPEGWDVLSLGRVTLDRCDGPFGSGLKSEHYTEAGVRVIRLQNIKTGGFDGSDEAFIDEIYCAEHLIGHDVQCGDVLIAGLGDDKNSVGRACVAPIGIEPAIVKADCFRFRLDDDRCLSAFVATQLTAGSTADAGVLSSGSTRSRIPLSVMSSRKIALPTLDEQSAIVAFLDTETAKIDALVGEARQAIGLLKERRSALISAAVTGKIDVRNAEVQA
jgi:type I restriction enzyme S subunit